MTTPLGAVLRGVVAGAAGTLAMDLVQFVRYRSGGGDQPFGRFELQGVESWDQAPAPAQVGRRVVEGLFQRQLHASQANLVNNVVHWSYGLGWGALFGLGAGSARRPRVRWGPLLGTVVFLGDYAALPPTGLYEPIWHYDAKTLAKDWGDHLVYGSAVGLLFWALSVGRHGR